ncbi:pentapeptide repeat-containing protein, partial [Pseudomonas emilianonis]|uniref:pentapeptide repeat-containing protein n=1 Tax=Pseudomonas emilianonis TaxID=2915812 RepID=UPI003D2FD746
MLTFARLLAITSICPCWASSPVFAVHSDRIIVRFLVYSTGRSALQYAQCQEMKATQASFVAANLTDTDFHAAELEGCDWRDANR